MQINIQKEAGKCSHGDREKDAMRTDIHTQGGRNTGFRGTDKHSQEDRETDTIVAEIHTQGAEKQTEKHPLAGI